MKMIYVFLAAMMMGPVSIAAPTFHCERKDSTKSFDIQLESFSNDGKAWSLVDTYQYPQTKNLFYYTREQRTVNGVKEILLFNENIYFEADRSLILRIDQKNKATLEVFWIQGSTGFGVGGESGSIIYGCR